MPETAATTYASFASTHEDRLVCSVMSDCGLSRAAAARVAATVLPAAYQRTFATCGAAYGWLRIAARHHAAGSAGWAEAADAALGRADSALVVLAGLSTTDRELLRLRYVDGLLPAALAERTGLSVDEVLAGLDRARAATREAAAAPVAAPDAPPVAVPAQRSAFSAPRAAAAVALVAAALLSGNGPAPAPPFATAPFHPGIAALTPATAAAPEASSAAATQAGRPAGVRVAGASATPATVVDGLGTGRPGSRDPGPSCRGRRCRDGKGFVDELHVPVPKQVGDVTGTHEVVIQEAAGDVVHLCDVLAPVPAGAARCVRRPLG